MVNGIGGSGAGKAAIEAALKSMRARAGGAARGRGRTRASAAPRPRRLETDFAEALKDGSPPSTPRSRGRRNCHQDVLAGRLDIHEAATAIKESKITFQFALQVRNKLMDAYREVMRMSV